MDRSNRRGFIWLAAVGALAALAASAHTEEPSRATRAAAVVVVEATVAQVFEAREGEVPDYVVELAIERVELLRRLPSGSTAVLPVPSDPLLVRASRGVLRPASPGNPARRGAVPGRGSRVRAWLAPREPGGWQAVEGDWFEVLTSLPAERPPAPQDPLRPSGLGLDVERVDLRGRTALRVTVVEPQGPAQQAGLEVGDVIVSAGGVPVGGAADLEALARRGVPFALTVLDGRTGRSVELEIAPARTAPPPTVRLGVTVEVVDAGGRTALKVVSLVPDGAAARAGIEVGDLLVAADGAALTSQEALRAALARGVPTMTLTVRDVRTGRDTPVQVTFAAAPPPPPPGPAPGTPPPGGTPPGGTGLRIERLGILAGVGLHDVESAVAVVEVLPGTAAARAGIRRGAVIFEAAGKKVLSPQDLDAAVRASGRTIRLGVEDPRTGATSTVDVPLD